MKNLKKEKYWIEYLKWAHNEATRNLMPRTTDYLLKHFHYQNECVHPNGCPYTLDSIRQKMQFTNCWNDRLELVYQLNQAKIKSNNEFA